MSNANDSVEVLGRLLQEGELMKVTGYETQSPANAGYLASASWVNPSGNSGHVATFAASDQEHNSNGGPMVANIGFTNGIKSVNQAFGVSLDLADTPSSMDEISYYFDPSQFDVSVPEFNKEVATEVIQ